MKRHRHRLPDPVTGPTLVDQPVTVIVPFMNGWKEQMYANVPAVSNVAVPVAPAAMLPVSKLPDEVAVWACLSPLVHVTVVPFATVSSAASNLKSLIDTASPPAAGAVDPPV